MKTILLLISALTLLTTSGCIIPEDHRDYHGHGEYRDHEGYREHEYREHSEHHGEPEPGVSVRIQPE